ncbi:hypothetical protein [Bacillus sp. WC2502]|uniref:hypothetical protein n=1 Tax=Bacillus sp. WC2502 TaxID=3461401 RepID=UPI00404472C8
MRIKRSFYIKVEGAMKRRKGGIVLGSCPNCSKAFSFVEKFHLSHTKMMMCPSCPHQIKETFVSKMSFFHALFDSAIGDAHSIERGFTHVEVADLIRMDPIEFLCTSADHSSVRADITTIK